MRTLLSIKERIVYFDISFPYRPCNTFIPLIIKLSEKPISKISASILHLLALSPIHLLFPKISISYFS